MGLVILLLLLATTLASTNECYDEGRFETHLYVDILSLEACPTSQDASEALSVATVSRSRPAIVIYLSLALEVDPDVARCFWNNDIPRVVIARNVTDHLGSREEPRPLGGVATTPQALGPQ